MVYVLLAEGFEELEALAPVDILRRGGIEVRTVGITGKTVCGSHGIPVIADILPDEVGDDMEMLVFPGGLPGSDHLHNAEATDRLIAMAKEKDAHIAAICAAPYILGLRGLLEGKRATSYPDDTFRSRLLGADVCGERVVTDGKITTGIGMGAAQEFGLRLLALLCGKEAAEKIAKGALITSAEDAITCP